MMGSTRADASTASSVTAVERALAWYLAEAPAAKAIPIPIDKVRLLRAALDGGVGAAELFDWFVSFGSVMYRMALVSPGVPACNVGDTLTTLMTLRAKDGDALWTFDPGVDRETFAKLGFANTSRGIALSQRNNREGWWAHAKHCCALVEAAATLPARRGLAVVLGVGHAFDLPLATLACSFERLVLIDVDREPVDAALRSLRGATATQIDVRAMDLTGVNRAMVSALDEIVAAPGAADEIQSRIEACCRSYGLPETPSILGPGEHADLVVSSCVVSQLAWPQRAYAHEALVRRFGPLSGVAERRWRLAWADFELRVQQDHINSLVGA